MAPGSFRPAPAKIQQILKAGKEQLSPEEFEEMEALLLDLETYGLTPWINTQLGKLMAKLTWELDVGESPEWHEALQQCDYAFLGSELKEMCYEVGASPGGHKKQLCARLFRRKHPAVLAVMEPYLKEMTPERIKDEIERYAQTVSPVTPEVTREPWQMTKAEFVERGTTRTALSPEMEHRGEVFAALRDGKPVPAEVLKDYPDMPRPTPIPTAEVERLPQTEPLWASKLREVKDRLEDIHRKDPEEFYRRKDIIRQAIKEREKGKQKTMPGFTLQELQELLNFAERLYR